MNTKDMFDTSAQSAQPNRPSTRDTPGFDRIDVMIRLAAEKCGVDYTEYHWHSMQYLDDKSHLLKIAKGNTPFKSGPRKGRINHKHCTAEKTVTITEAELAEAIAAYEAETGYCTSCSGSGQAVAGWNRDEGTRFKTCKRCSGTGRLQQEDAPPC